MTSASFAIASSVPAPLAPPPPVVDAPPPFPTLAERQRALGRELDALKARVLAQLGESDLAHARRVQAVSTAAEVVGRTLLHVSLDPLTWTAGVMALWLHKQLEATELGHTALHGAYDKLPDGARWHSDGYAWDVPIDEEAWKHGHNHKHHGNTNVAGKDPDIHFGPIRLTAALLPHLETRADAAILNVTSGLAFVPFALTPTYSATKAALHSWTMSLGHQLKGTSVEAIEIAPPYVQTELMGPHQAVDPRAMPLADFIAEVMAILGREPTPAEVIVGRCEPLRHAERDGKTAEIFAALAAH